IRLTQVTSSQTPSPTPTPTQNGAPVVTLISPANGTAINASSNLTVQANASDSDGTITKVDFFENGALIGTATSSPYSVNWNQVPKGTFSLTAKATDNSGRTALSAPVTINVRKSPQSVKSAAAFASSIAGTFNWQAGSYPGASGGPVSESSAVSADLTELAADVKQAYI